MLHYQNPILFGDSLWLYDKEKVRNNDVIRGKRNNLLWVLIKYSLLFTKG